MLRYFAGAVHNAPMHPGANFGARQRDLCMRGVRQPASLFCNGNRIQRWASVGAVRDSYSRRSIVCTAFAVYGLPPPVTCPWSASAALILRNDIRCRCISLASATTSGRGSARGLRPAHLPVSAFLRARAAASLWTTRSGRRSCEATGRLVAWPGCAATRPRPQTMRQ